MADNEFDVSPPKDPSDIRTLVVDDDPACLDLLGRIFEEAGYQVDRAPGGEEGLRLIESQSYDVIVADLRMPDEDGEALLRAAKQVDDRVIVIIVSGFGTIETAVELMKLGAADFISKPFGAEQVRIATTRALRMRRLEDMARASQYYERLSRTDALTGLANRRAFDDSLRREADRTVRYGHALSLLLIDVDHFKQVNDTYGHPSGDDLLCKLSQQLTKAVRQHDLVARWGGDEFALLLPVTDAEGVYGLVRRVLDVVPKTPFRPRDTDAEIRVTISLGSATLPGHADNPTKLIHVADACLYLAKERGRDQYCAPEDTQTDDAGGPVEPDASQAGPTKARE